MNTNIANYIDANDLKYYQNKIDCICLLATGEEFNNGLFDHFMENIEATSDRSKKLLSNIDLKIITGSTHDKDVCHKIERYFKSIELFRIYIPSTLDVYYHHESDVVGDKMPKLGLKSGPNHVFFEAVRTLEGYNTTLMLECDVFLSKDWFEQINNYVDNANGFWISGSLYYGDNRHDINHVINTHLNGGVCLYATGCNGLQKFLSFCKEKLIQYVSSGITNLPYDMSIKMSIDEICRSSTEKHITSFIKNQYVSNKLILNYSGRSDKSQNEHDIYSLYRYAVLHKKK